MMAAAFQPPEREVGWGGAGRALGGGMGGGTDHSLNKPEADGGF